MFAQMFKMMFARPEPAMSPRPVFYDRMKSDR